MVVGRVLAAPLLTFNSGTRRSVVDRDLAAATAFSPLSLTKCHTRRKSWTIRSSTADPQTLPLTDEEQSTWDSCREVLSAFDFDTQEKDKMLGKAFGHVPSPYWGEERKQEVPRFEVVHGILEYLRSLGLSDDDILKVLKKFPEVMGCSLEDDLKKNVGILEKVWAIKGKSLKNLLLRNPKVLGYNVDCKGDCIAQCTRCWVRF
ncbi:unnamed protein product [Linum trigynum]|uniref:Mitochondrial transcription termination factor family protein n=1 Tax=Linum trigynum TaxID=586398 RepID=A0AAV2GGZ1_9ROSI